MYNSIDNKIGEVCVGCVTLSIVENTYLMSSFNASISALYKDLNGNYKIIVDNSYHSCPEYVKKFFIQHEVGHYVNGDLQCSNDEANARHYARLQGELHVSELLADEYAASQLTKIDLFKTATYLNYTVIKVNKVINKMERDGELTAEQASIERNSVREIKIRSNALSRLLGKRFIMDLFKKRGV